MSEKESTDEAYYGQYDVEKCLLGLRILDIQNKEFWPRISITGKTSLDAILNISYVTNSIKRKVWDFLGCDEFVEHPSRENIELDIANQFTSVPRVKCIYTDDYQGIKRFLIFTTNRKYDNELMEHLLSIEKDIRQSNTMPLSFEYIPRLIDSPDDMLSKDAKLIYKRGYDVFVSGAYMAGWSQQEAGQTAAWRFSTSGVVI